MLIATMTLRLANSQVSNSLSYSLEGASWYSGLLLFVIYVLTAGHQLVSSIDAIQQPSCFDTYEFEHSNLVSFKDLEYLTI